MSGLPPGNPGAQPSPNPPQPAFQAWPGTASGRPWQSGWYVPPAAVHRNPPASAARWLGTILVALVIAAVTLGGFVLDSVLAAPTAGNVGIGQGVSMTAGPGWVLTHPQPKTGVELQKGDAILAAEGDRFAGTPATVLAQQKRLLRADVAGISFGAEKDGEIGGHRAALVDFTAIVNGTFGSGTIDGELICLTVGDRTVVVLAYAPQGDLSPVSGDVTAMLESLRIGK